jgi:class 3 adenylate cyclase
MFSDIEDSSTLNLQLGDEEWARVIQVHDEVVRGIVRSNRGRVIKTLGDGFMASFADTERAVLCGLELQDVLSSHDDVGHGLGLRIGVHAGPAVSRDGDLFGENVVIAARVGGAARAGDVLVSDVVKQRLADSDVVAFDAHRRVRLKGIPGRYDVYVASATSPGED